MRLLVIGRTALVGRHLVDAPLAAGHDVTLFHRGRTGRDLFPRVQAAGLNDGNDGGPGASRSCG